MSEETSGVMKTQSVENLPSLTDIVYILPDHLMTAIFTCLDIKAVLLMLSWR